MALAKSGFGKDTAERLLVDSAVIYKNVKWNNSTKEFDGDLLGATTGGVEISIEKKYRKPEVDGTYLMGVKGLELVESAEATIKTTILELSADNITMAMGGKQSSSVYDGYTQIEDNYTVSDDDYIENMAVVGTLSGKDKPIIIIFDNVLITSSLQIKTEDKKEAGIEIEGTAHATYEQLQDRKSPYRILYPDAVNKKSSTATTSSASNSSTL